ncbi:uncharacterized protein LOC126071366 [Elephas maximus indicus]|uniref:uncharacterized protein LOC126071366 n=1 Tax=Elephas maximus indicus TaxID=99487 RepID=UPI002116F02A|nr:uncharacterized protein LOC126071366 [Elephas maximus indicus]
MVGRAVEEAALGLEVSRTRLPRSWPRGVAAAGDARTSLFWTVQETARRDGGARAALRRLSPPGSQGAAWSALASRSLGLADEPDQWKAASSRLSAEGALRPIEGPRVLRSVARWSPAPAPALALTPLRPAARLLLRAAPAVHVNFQASAAAPWAGRGEGKPTRAGLQLTCCFRLPPPLLEALRSQMEGRAASEPLCRGEGSSAPTPAPSLTSQPPTALGLTSTPPPHRAQSRLLAKLNSLCVSTSECGAKNWRMWPGKAWGISSPFLDLHQLLFTSILIRNSAISKASDWCHGRRIW